MLLHVLKDVISVKYFDSIDNFQIQMVHYIP